jgi:hypothetical protein
MDCFIYGFTDLTDLTDLKVVVTIRKIRKSVDKKHFSDGIMFKSHVRLRQNYTF